jgi:2-keto-4-pentenoate hydratase/2-oxohepta-3-ene-1,7-dioic acid hydratase in catechol pathway
MSRLARKLPSMRLTTFDAGDGPRAGVLRGEQVLDAWHLLGEPERSGMKELIAAGRIDELAERLDGRAGTSGPDPLTIDRVSLLPPVPDPDKIVCIGLNYRSHAEEFDLELPAAPTIFGKYRNALTGHGRTVTLPAASSKVDYEAEIAFVVGRRASHVAPDEALSHVAGYTLLNDLSARDLQFLTPQWMPGKVFDGSAPCGPWLVTPDEAGPHDSIGISLDLNGEQMQSSHSGDLIFSVPELVSRLSEWMTLEPGDIVSTGTPSGVGSARKPRVWLGDGDELEVASPQLGRLRTTIAR